MHRSKRPPVQWVPGQIAPTGMVAATLRQDVLVDSRLASTAGIPAIARMTVKTVIGDVIFDTDTAAATAVVDVGIIVVDQSAALGLSTPDPSVVGDLDAGWLWRRTFRLGSTATPLAGFMSSNQDILPDGAHVHIRSKRILKPNQALVMMSISTLACTITWRLRTLISRVA